MATKFNAGAGSTRIDQHAVNALIQTAKTATQTGDFPTAIASFEKLLAIDPKNVGIMSNLGILHYNTGNRERAVRIFSDAFASAPQNEEFRKNLLLSLAGAAADKIAQGGFQQAINWQRKGLSIDPEHTNLRIGLANALELSKAGAELSDFMPGGLKISGHVRKPMPCC